MLEGQGKDEESEEQRRERCEGRREGRNVGQTSVGDGEGHLKGASAEEKGDIWGQ